MSSFFKVKFMYNAGHVSNFRKNITIDILIDYNKMVEKNLNS